MKTFFKPLAAVLTASVITSTPIQASVNPSTMIDSGELYEVEATAYCNPDGNLTCTGRKTTEGLTIATAPELLGTTIYIWSINDDGSYEFMGIYEAMDTGSNEKLKSGQAVDIFMEDYDRCIEWGRQKVMIQVVRSKG